MVDEILNIFNVLKSRNEWDVLDAFAKVLWHFEDAEQFLSTSKNMSH